MEEQDYEKEQLALSKRIHLDNTVDMEKIRTVAGVDLAYWRNDGKEYAVCCIVVLDWHTHKVVERASFVDAVKVPYIPGCLAYREIPIFMEAYQKIHNPLDVVFFDGNGYLHPRHMGLATHAGILLDKATVGIAKTYYKVEDVDFSMPEDESGAYTEIRIHGQVYGRALRTHAGVRPVFVSIGNKIDLETATRMAMDLTEKEGHVPLPTRLADLMTHEERKKLCKSLIHPI